MTIAVLDYGMGNLLSVERALLHVGGSGEITADPDRIASSDALLIPGVGRFGACMRALTSSGLDRVVRDFVGTGRPVFGVCLGMQVLFDRSDEDPEPGLGLIGGRVRRLPGSVKVPHMGWNEVRWVMPHGFVDGIEDGTRFYFVHSYAADVSTAPSIGITEHGRPFVSVIASRSIFATQFHPEKSGDAGLQIYENFVKTVASQ